jgi:hypothetical protein
MKYQRQIEGLNQSSNRSKTDRRRELLGAGGFLAMFGAAVAIGGEDKGLSRAGQGQRAQLFTISRIP